MRLPESNKDTATSRLKEKQQKLIAANMQGKEKDVDKIVQEVATEYGMDYATGWRKMILEQHAGQRNATSLLDLSLD